ncbi:hypothetical protein [Paraflavitalea speifideaquila]|uniref:hypothetical protein n=1 Tax=Paraflavitalea speifideaquila TaxID=3076558 RepID=UPI0028E9BEF5|nr:hypothetical protein [Paraflavitalea speifideiaquila]
MAPDDWVKYKTKDGKTHVTWDVNVNSETTKEQLETVRGKGAENLGKEAVYKSNENGNQTWALHDGGKFEEVPAFDLGALGKAASAAGTGVGAVQQGAEQGFKLVANAMQQNLDNADDLTRLVKSANGLSRTSSAAGKISTGAGMASLGITIVDGLTSKKDGRIIIPLIWLLELRRPLF